MKIRPYLPHPMQLQALVMLAAVHTTTPWIGHGPTVAERTSPSAQRVPASTPFDSLRCGILVGDGLRLQLERSACDDTRPSFLSV